MPALRGDFEGDEGTGSLDGGAFVGDVCGLGAENTGGRENTALLVAADEGSGVFDGPAKESFVGKIAADECDAGVGLTTGDVGEAG